MRILSSFTVRAAIAIGFSMVAAQADVITIPQAALVPSTQLYTTDIGGGYGTALVMTGGGSVPNIGGSPNDDGFSGPIPLGFILNFFGNNYTSFFANNNGNISFGDGLSQFTPSGPQGASTPVISPFFADVDTRGTNSGLMYLRNDIANEIIITWDHVGYFGAHDDKLNTFQLVVRGPDYAIPAGQGQIGFFWTTMQWETGDASGGSAGFGGTPAAVGFGDGQSNGQVLEGSTANGIAAEVQNHRLWFTLDSSGTPIPVPPSGVPEPSSMALLGFGLAGLGIVARRRMRS